MRTKILKIPIPFLPICNRQTIFLKYTKNQEIEPLIIDYFDQLRNVIDPSILNFNIHHDDENKHNEITISRINNASDIFYNPSMLPSFERSLLEIYLTYIVYYHSKSMMYQKKIYTYDLDENMPELFKTHVCHNTELIEALNDITGISINDIKERINLYFKF